MRSLTQQEIDAHQLADHQHYCSTQYVQSEPYPIPTQVFNALANQQTPSTAVVFLAGFSAMHYMFPAGVLGDVSKQFNADFVRFYHPTIRLDPSVFSYSATVQDAVNVIKTLPHQNIVIAASSFGAGMARFVIDEVHQLQPNRVRGLFAWSAIPPEGICNLFQHQKNYSAFMAGQDSHLRVYEPTMQKEFPLRVDQVADLQSYCNKPTAAFTGVSYFVNGALDAVSLASETRRIATQMGVHSVDDVVEVLPNVGHKQSEAALAAGLTRVLSSLK